MSQLYPVSSLPDTKNCRQDLAVPPADQGVSSYLRPLGRLSFFRRASLTCPQMMAVIATVTTASTAQSQCITISNTASISSSLIGQVVFLSVSVLVASVLLALCIFHYVIDSRVRAQGDAA